MDVFLNSPQEVKGRSPVHMRKKRYIGLLGRYGRAIRGFPGSLPGSGTQLPENRHRNPFYRAGLVLTRNLKSCLPLNGEKIIPANKFVWPARCPRSTIR